MSDISHHLFSAVQASVGSRVKMVGAILALCGKVQVLPAVREEELDLSCRMQLLQDAITTGCSYSALPFLYEGLTWTIHAGPYLKLHSGLFLLLEGLL